MRARDVHAKSHDPPNPNSSQGLPTPKNFLGVDGPLDENSKELMAAEERDPKGN